MSHPKRKHLLGIGIIAFALQACSLSTPAPRTLPEHTVAEYWKNNNATNIGYYIVADKSLTEEEARSIITYYQNEEEGYKLINIWVFCDKTYAAQMFLNDIFATDDKFFSHVLYWYQTGEWSSAGTIFQTKPDESYPTFGSACK